MSVYSRIFAATSQRLQASRRMMPNVPKEVAIWAFPGFLGASWFLWGALTEDIKRSVGLYWDPDATLNLSLIHI